jgi:hypothetical protein
MDLSFARRRKATDQLVTPELPVLLSEISARQGASRTARIQARLDAAKADRTTDPVVEVFAPNGPSAAATHRFSDEILIPVNSRKLT